ncbi:Endo-polygalacturonase PG1 [Sarocladium implicatum]|nr:Endo-polygalacturonase PG1 [Sarocladium implicatum]
MNRSKKFASPGRAPPFDHDDTVRLVPGTVTGPLPFLNPTRAQFKVVQGPRSTQTGGEEAHKSELDHVVPGAEVAWRSRDNRKGRHILTIDPAHHPHLKPTSRPGSVLTRIARMFTTCPYWDISYWVAVLFTVGCLIFIACGLLAWFPLAYDSLADDTRLTDASGWTSLVGATLFQAGAVLLLFEAWNEERTGCFGWALRKALGGGDLEAEPDLNDCKHHHQQQRHGKTVVQDGDGNQTSHVWQWYPSWNDLRTHYMHEIGFLASFYLSIGATIFYISGIMAITPIYDRLSPSILYGLYYMAYLVGAVFFVFSSALYILETQAKWYLPAPQLLGWHIGVWNMVGSVGWTLAAAFGYCAEAKGRDGGWCAYQSQLSLVWASVGFTIGSALLWYEAVNKYSVETSKRLKRGDGDSDR